MASVYIHIPFCERKCKYCSFVSYSELGKIDNYIVRLCEEIRACNIIDIDTLYIGGGTPSLLNACQLKSIMGALAKHNMSPNCEFTIECNPNSLTREKLLLYKDIGVNRISVGAQSLCDNVLSCIGRLHNGMQALQAVKQASKIFDNVSVDLILGLPFQTWDMLKCDIESLAPYVEHFSIYSLMVEDGTALERMVANGEIALPDEDACVDMYDNALTLLRRLGFERYEVSNFTKSKPSRHNLAYWTGIDYYGFGVASHSFVDGVRYSNTENLDEYLQGITIINKYSLNLQQKKEEYIMLGLRTAKGISLDYMQKRFGESVNMHALKKLQNADLINCINDHVALTDKGFHLLNAIVLELIS